MTTQHCFFDSRMEQPEILEVSEGETAVFSEPAPGGEENQDAALIATVPGAGLVLAVADGAGGYENGAWAARKAIEHISESIARTEPGELRNTIVDGIERANESIKTSGSSAGTTLVLAEISESMLRPIHIGDSTLLVTSNRGRIKWQTIPHSPTGYAVEAGFMTENEALHHDERHLVSNLLGHDAARIEVGMPIRLAPRDTLLLGSDGLFDNLATEQIVSIIRKGPLVKAAKELAELCRTKMNTTDPGELSKPDDLTFLLYRKKPTPPVKSPATLAAK